MDLFAKVLQGPYAYLLILQILIVAGLLLTLIYLIMLRLRQPALAVAEVASAHLQAHAPVEAAPAATQIVVNDQSLLAERERARALEQEVSSLRDKVRYLESKLLEYEILQEEIGALSALKLENEKLRQELLSIRQGPGSPAAPSEAAPVIPMDTVVAAVPGESVPAVAAPALVPDLDLAATVASIEPSSDLLPSAADDEATRSALDGLLQQIDSITSEPTPADKQKL